MNPINFVFQLIAIGLGLLSAGTIAEIVVDLERKAAHDTEVGIVSIGDWNRELFGEHPKPHHRGRK